MKYDYFEVESSGTLYRVKVGCQKPVKLALGGFWIQSKTYPTKDELLKGIVRQISIARAKQLSNGSPVKEETSTTMTIKRTVLEIQRAHDMLCAIVNKEVPNPVSSPTNVDPIKVAADVLCWVLGCHNNRAFGENLKEIENALSKAGYQLNLKGGRG